VCDLGDIAGIGEGGGSGEGKSKLSGLFNPKARSYIDAVRTVRVLLHSDLPIVIRCRDLGE
jgi:hypothetical protein